MMRYYIVTPSGKVGPYVPALDKPTLGEMQAVVDGYIERVRCNWGDMYVNEDGISLGLLVNAAASRIAPSHRIHGTALLCVRKGYALTDNGIEREA